MKSEIDTAKKIAIAQVANLAVILDRLKHELTGCRINVQAGPCDACTFEGDALVDEDLGLRVTYTCDEGSWYPLRSTSPSCSSRSSASRMVP
ncbi:hypothetical protein V6L77_18460 [Pannonibacter sp. Pt2-lr]